MKRRLVFILILLLSFSAGCQPQMGIACFRLRSPGGRYAIEQASGLHDGRIGWREGLWLVCDRNGGQSAGQLFYISQKQLDEIVPGQTIRADEVFAVALPRNWQEFADRFRNAGRGRLAELRRQIVATRENGEQPLLDLEAVMFAPGVSPPHEPHIFVAAEQPNSLVLELRLEEGDEATVARLVGAYFYNELPAEKGWDSNDGIEGLAWGDRPGQVYWAEEGSRSHTADPKPRLMFTRPRIGRGVLCKGRLNTEARYSELLTRAVWKLRSGEMQTLNGLARMANGELLAVDRNGGKILRIDPARGEVKAWLNLYDLEGRSLRDILGDFPARRRMPYVSIEGLAVDPRGYLWLVDDPAMPEAFRESCLVKIGPFQYLSSSE